MRLHLLAIAALASLGSAPAASAVQDPANSRASIQQLVPQAVSPDNQSGGGFVVPSFQVLADVKGGATAQLTIAGASDNAGSFGETTYGLTFSAPINKKTNEGSLLTQRGLPSGFAAEFSFSTIMGNSPDFSGPADPATGPVRDSLQLLNFNASIGVDNFSYRDPVTFVEQERRRTSYALSGSYGFMTASNRGFFAIGGEFRRRYKAPDEQILCPAPAPPAPTECIEDAFAPPARQTELNLFGLARTMFHLGRNNTFPIAVEIRATYDARNDVFGVEAPIYFLQGAGGGLRGGFRIGWDSDHNDVRGSVFIGVPFELIRL